MLNILDEIQNYWSDQPTNPASVADINEIEALVKKRLPDDFREYITTYGNKEFDITGWSSVKARYDMNPDVVEKPVALIALFSPAQIKDRLQAFGEPMMHYPDVGRRIPFQTLPIGEAAADTQGLILLQLDEKNYGSLWYWERVDETWGTGENTLLGALGRNIQDMLSNIKENE